MKIKNDSEKQEQIQNRVATTENDAAAVYLQQALAYREEMQWIAVIQSCEKALKLNPKLAEAYKLLGDANQSLGKFSISIGYYGKAISIKPDFTEVYANLGSLYAQRAKWQQALDYYQKALAIQPDLAEIYKHVARVWQNLGEPEKAQRMLAQAQKLESQPQSRKSPQEFFNSGERAYQQGNLPQALKYYQQAVQQAPNFGQAYQRLAAITEKMGLWQESTIYYRQLLHLKDSLGISSLPKVDDAETDKIIEDVQEYSVQEQKDSAQKPEKKKAKFEFKEEDMVQITYDF